MKTIADIKIPNRYLERVEDIRIGRDEEDKPTWEVYLRKPYIAGDMLTEVICHTKDEVIDVITKAYKIDGIKWDKWVWERIWNGKLVIE